MITDWAPLKEPAASVFYRTVGDVVQFAWTMPIENNGFVFVIPKMPEGTVIDEDKMPPHSEKILCAVDGRPKWFPIFFRTLACRLDRPFKK